MGYPAFIGLRYSFSRQRNRFTTLVSLVSMLGMVIGVASLIVVLSVMNGFAGELRGRILALVPHGYLLFDSPALAEDWQSLADRVASDPAVLGVAPYREEKALLGAGRGQRGVQLTGIDTAREGEVSRMPGTLVAGRLDALDEAPFRVVLGASLARMLGVSIGDSVRVTLPRFTATPLGLFPRSRRLEVVGLFRVGAEQDAKLAYVSLDTANRLLGGTGAPTGLKLRTADLFEAPATLERLAAGLPHGVRALPWSDTQGSLFRAVRMEKLTVSLLLLSVVAVAAFNIVATLVMSVAEKREDIAVLRTLGADPPAILRLFVVHGAALAVLGVALGAVLGVLLALSVDRIAAVLEGLLQARLFDPAVYFITGLPAELRWSDVVTVVAASLGLGVLATLYPAWRASRVAPAEALRRG
ncbi:MAG: lipoprotein-releasing ABC transporter permease subunit [Pseudohaliea sp.]